MKQRHSWIFTRCMVSVMLMGIIVASVPAMAAPLTREGLTVIDKDNFDATPRITYTSNHLGETFIDWPEVIENRTLQPDGTIIYRTDWNVLGEKENSIFQHEPDRILGNGAYITVDNILKGTVQKTDSSSFISEISKGKKIKSYEKTDDYNMLFSKGPVTVTFCSGNENPIYPEYGNYGNEWSIIKRTDYEIARGVLLHSGRKLHTEAPASSEEIFATLSGAVDGEPTTATQVLTEPGMYRIELSCYLGGMSRVPGPVVWVIILDGTEDMTDTIQQTATATPSTAPVNVNGKVWNVPAYKMNGNNFLKIRDIAYILNGTSKEFDTSYLNNNIHLARLTPYNIVGGEMAPLKVGNKHAKLTSQTFNMDAALRIYPLAYSIGGSNYVMLRDIGKIMDFWVGYDSTTSTVLIDTGKSYKGTAEIIPQAAVKADYRKYHVFGPDNTFESYTIGGETYWRLNDFALSYYFYGFGYGYDADSNTLTVDNRYRNYDPPIGPKIPLNAEWATPVSLSVIKGDLQFPLTGYKIRQEFFFTVASLQKIYNFHMEWVDNKGFQDGGYYFVDINPEDGINRPEVGEIPGIK